MLLASISFRFPVCCHAFFGPQAEHRSISAYLLYEYIKAVDVLQISLWLL